MSTSWKQQTNMDSTNKCQSNLALKLDFCPPLSPGPRSRHQVPGILLKSLILFLSYIEEDYLKEGTDEDSGDDTDEENIYYY